MLRATAVGEEQGRVPGCVGGGCGDWLWRMLKADAKVCSLGSDAVPG